MIDQSLPVDSATLWPALVDEAYVQGIRDYVSRVIMPEADRIDREDIYPVEILKDMARQGYNTVVLEPEYGGRGLSFLHAAAVCEEVAVASAAVGVSLITIYQAQTMLRLFGVDSLKRRYLPAFAEGPPRRRRMGDQGREAFHHLRFSGGILHYPGGDRTRRVGLRGAEGCPRRVDL
jgi:alkylation response protein AidB-like acyl-CoA dehydrogenase